MANGDLEALGLAVTLMGSRGMTDSTVRVHSDDGLARLVIPGMHLSDGVPKAVAGRLRKEWECT
jgi:hypothetical protein